MSFNPKPNLSTCGLYQIVLRALAVITENIQHGHKKGCKDFTETRSHFCCTDFKKIFNLSAHSMHAVK